MKSSLSKAHTMDHEPAALAPLPFTVAFDSRDEEAVMARWRKVLRSQRWSFGEQMEEFEHLWTEWNRAPGLSFDNWSGGALAALDFIDVRGETVLCPSNTFLATPRSVSLSGGEIAFYDCNRHDLCGSFDDFVEKAERLRPKAAWVVHIGGHIAFDIEKIAGYCRDKGIWLLEDCAHAHGAHWNGKKPGTWGDAGVYSFYATNTVPLGEGGMLVSTNDDLLKHAKSYRDYGRGSNYSVSSLNHRMSEFTAALGAVQVRRMDEIVAWKRRYARDILEPAYPNRVKFPEGMESGYYKFIVFDPIEKTTGKVYEFPCHRLLKHDQRLPNTEWISKNHWCAPIYYPRREAGEGG